MSIITSLTTYFKAANLLTGKAIWVDYLGETPTEYSVAPLPGTRITAEYLDGKKDVEFPFAFNAVVSTMSDAERLETVGFFESFADWLQSQTNAGTLPTLDAGKTATGIEALGWGYMMEQGPSGTAIYQVQCKLYYKQA